MGLLTDVHNNQSVRVEDNQVTLIRKTKKGALIVCPKCHGLGFTNEYYPDYAGATSSTPCFPCNGGGVIEIKLKRKVTKRQTLIT